MHARLGTLARVHCLITNESMSATANDAPWDGDAVFAGTDRIPVRASHKLSLEGTACVCFGNKNTNVSALSQCLYGQPGNWG